MPQVESIPLSAFRFDASVSSIKAYETEGSISADIKILARSNKPINHWYWGKIVHDMEGVRHKDRLTLDYCHDEDQIIGYADEIEIVEEGLSLGGKLVSVDQGDRASTVIKQGQAGIPFEGSIFFDDAILEYVDEGFQTEVNGETFQGPGVVVREWVLRGCAVCPYGADGSTNSSFAESSAVKFSWRGKAMPRKAKSADKLTAETQTEEVVATATESTETESTAEASASETAIESASEEEPKGGELSTSADPSKLGSDRSELRRYMQRFGDADGAKFFADGLDYQAAQDKYIDKLSADRDAAIQRAEDAESKLSAIRDQHGEKEAIRTGTFSTKTQPKVTSISQAKQLAASRN